MLKLSNGYLQEMITYAHQSYPEECCGLLIGQQENTKKIVRTIYQTRNSWGEDCTSDLFSSGGSKRNRFAIAPAELLQAQKTARAQNLSIVGIYHSHPNAAAIPSKFDRAIAWPEYSYLIISLQQQPVAALCWQLDEQNQFQPEEIIKLR